MYIFHITDHTIEILQNWMHWTWESLILTSMRICCRPTICFVFTVFFNQINVRSLTYVQNEYACQKVYCYRKIINNGVMWCDSIDSWPTDTNPSWLFSNDCTPWSVIFLLHHRDLSMNMHFYSLKNDMSYILSSYSNISYRGISAEQVSSHDHLCYSSYCII